MTTTSAAPVATTTTPPPAAACGLSIIIVSWNVWELLRACLVSIERATRPLPGAAATGTLRCLVPPEAQTPPPAGRRSIPTERPAPAPVRRRTWGRALFGDQP
ncbi:MAG: glycosyltransferase family 2 protein, partial [Caldilineaceae bacterium]